MERNICLDWQGFVTEAVKRRKEMKLTLNSFEQGKTNIKLDNALKILTMLGLA
jgi:hypothetical protein